MNILQLSKEIPNLKVEVLAKDLVVAMETVATGIIERYENVEEPEQYLTRKATAQMLDVDLSTLWRWDKEQYLEVVKIGGKRRHRLSDIKRILGVEAKQVPEE